MKHPDGQGLQCVDPSVGDRILDLVTPGAATEDRRVLAAHAEVCAACRLALDLHRHLEQDGAALRRPVARRRAIHSWTAWASGLAAAACLVCLLTLPPQPDRAVGVTRGEDGPGFTRPVEGEVVTTGGLPVAWTAVPGADAYRLRLADTDGQTLWTIETRTTSATIPTGSGLASGTAYRLTLATDPADLLPPGGASVAFRAGGHGAVLAQRVVRPRPIVLVLAAASLLLGAAPAASRRLRSGPAVVD